MPPSTTNARRPISLDMIETLIGFPTVSRDSNLDLIYFIRDTLADQGVESLIVPDDSGRKANLYATLGPTDRPGICLSGHTDVVPVDGQDWDSDPFQLTERDGRLYGRGTADMKGFVAIAMAMVPTFLSRELETPIHLAFSYDEEIGCIGVRGLLAKLDAMPIKPSACIVGEPTSMKPVIGHKGKRSVRVHVRGLEGHSSLAHQGVNAVHFAADAIAFLHQMARDKRKNGPFDQTFDPPYTTVHIGTIQGGTALNIVPRDCMFEFEFRHLPVEDPNELFAEFESHVRDVLEPEMRQVDANAGFRFEEMSTIAGLDTEEDDPTVTLTKVLAGANDTGKVAFGTEGGLFQKIGIPTVVCGPGSIEQAHKPNEFIEIEQVLRCEDFMHKLCERVAA
ncbi:MAG: acetylornithine deacetylase [Pseudomonadota bacterium]